MKALDVLAFLEILEGLVLRRNLLETLAVLERPGFLVTPDVLCLQ
jgi:hypothetical protein